MQECAQVEVIAEAGSNHNGSLDRAKELIELASSTGASSIKFQFIFAEGLYIPQFFDGNSYTQNPAFAARKSEEMPESAWEEVFEYGRSVGIPVSASVFCKRGVELLARLGAPYVKLASTDVTNHELFATACERFDHVVASTGMATLAEIEGMVRFVRDSFPETRLRLMHCVSSYPCPLRAANTQRVALLKQCFGLPVGYSDHTADEVSAAMALVEGASFFEKHFTTSRTLPGFDHAHALTGAELKSYVATLNDAAMSLKLPASQVGSNEKTTKVRARRGVYAARDLVPGHVLTRDDLLLVRPSTSFDGCDLSDFVGTVLNSRLRKYEPIGLVAGAIGGEGNWAAAQDYWIKEMREKGMLNEDEKTE